MFDGTNMKKGDRVAQLVGWEYHGAPLGKHPDLVVLSEGPGLRRERRASHGDLRNDDLHGAQREPGVQRRHLLVERGPALSPPGFQNPPRKDFLRNDARIQRITKNVLDRMLAVRIVP